MRKSKSHSRNSRVGAALLLGVTAAASSQAADFTSAASGNWNSAGTWTTVPPGNGPQIGSTDNAVLTGGHTVLFTGANVGVPGSGDWGVSGGKTVTIEGGAIFSQTLPNYHQRIGQGGVGTVNINEGRWHFTDSTATASPVLHVGVNGGNGIINIGDGVGAAETAVFNLRDRIDGTANNVNVQLNLGVTAAGNSMEDATITINSDGLLIGDQGVIFRAGQAASSKVTMSINGAGGTGGKALFTRDFYFADGNDSRAILNINGAGALFEQNSDATGVFGATTGSNAQTNITNGGILRTTAELVFSRNAGSSSTTVIDGSGSRLEHNLFSSGYNSDMRIGLNGTAVVTVQNQGAIVRNATNKYLWIGQNSGSNGTLNLLSGGTFTNASGAHTRIGYNTGAVGLLYNNGGTFTNPSELHIGFSGNGTYHQVSGTTTISGDTTVGGNNASGGAGGGTGAMIIEGGTATFANTFRVANTGTGSYRQEGGTVNMNGAVFGEFGGNATFTLNGGTLSTSGTFRLGGNSNSATGTGTSNGVQNGGTLNVGGSLIYGLAPGYTTSYTANAGVINHTGSDTSVGESGKGHVTLGAAATFNDSTTGSFFVGRNAGSHGELYVNGNLTRTNSTSGIQVGLVNAAGTGVLGGTGTINPGSGGVRIGSAGSLTASTLVGVGTLTINGNLDYSPGGKFHMDFDGLGGADLIKVNGVVNLGSGTLQVDWVSGGRTDPANRYWAIDNDGTDAITGVFSNVAATMPGFDSLMPTADGWVIGNGQIFGVYYSADLTTGALTGGNDLLLVAVPEPGRAITALIAAMGLLMRRRRA